MPTLTKELMKKFKTKTYDFKRYGNHTKLHFQWFRGGDVEVTLIVLAGKQKHLSGLFAIAPTKKEAMERLWRFCCERYHGGGREVVHLLPWDDWKKGKLDPTQ